MAGTWVLSPQGARAAWTRRSISYAPPGFPFLVGLAYGLLGVSDVSAILVSIVAGTLTIPVVGWLAYRTFGRGAGAAASAFAALSGPHIAFSRMALTDASFLLFWLLAIGQGQRFLERPGFPRAVVLGLAVGVAQLFKYNGWIAGVVVALGAALWVAPPPRANAPRRRNGRRLGMGTVRGDRSRPSSTGPGSGSSSRTAAMPRSWPTSAATWAASHRGPAMRSSSSSRTGALGRGLVAGLGGLVAAIAMLAALGRPASRIAVPGERPRWSPESHRALLVLPRCVVRRRSSG